MVVVMSPDASEAHVDTVVTHARKAGGDAFVSRGLRRTIIGLVGDVDALRALNLRSFAGVADVIAISTPYKLVSVDHQPGRSTVLVGTDSGAQPVAIGPDTFSLIAGPCAVESLGQAFEAAEMAKAAGAVMLRGAAFKPGASPQAFQGLGIAGLEILAEIRDATGLPVVTEVIDPADVDTVVAHADMLQVGARNMQNYALLRAVGAAGKPVMLKRGIYATVDDWLMAAEYVAQRGNLDIVLCDRGIRTFETTVAASLDISAIPVVQGLSHLPVIVDPTHAADRRSLVLPLSRSAVGAGADGIVVDVHPDPDTAMSDGPHALAGADVRELASSLRRLAPAVGRRLDKREPAA